jgi:hypothetical protein
MRPVPDFADLRVSIRGAPLPHDGVQSLRLEGHRFREFFCCSRPGWEGGHDGGIFNEGRKLNPNIPIRSNK